MKLQRRGRKEKDFIIITQDNVEKFVQKGSNSGSGAAAGNI